MAHKYSYYNNLEDSDWLQASPRVLVKLLSSYELISEVLVHLLKIIFRSITSEHNLNLEKHLQSL